MNKAVVVLVSSVLERRQIFSSQVRVSYKRRAASRILTDLLREQLLPRKHGLL